MVLSNGGDPGATGVELLAISGHSSLDEVQVYIEEVEQEPAADAAMMKLAKVPEKNRNIE
jgi:hypothetical protein